MSLFDEARRAHQRRVDQYVSERFGSFPVITDAYIPEDTVITIPRRDALDFRTYEQPGQVFMHPRAYARMLQVFGSQGDSEDGDALERIRNYV